MFAGRKCLRWSMNAKLKRREIMQLFWRRNGSRDCQRNVAMGDITCSDRSHVLGMCTSVSSSVWCVCVSGMSSRIFWSSLFVTYNWMYIVNRWQFAVIVFFSCTHHAAPSFIMPSFIIINTSRAHSMANSRFDGMPGRTHGPITAEKVEATAMTRWR